MQKVGDPKRLAIGLAESTALRTAFRPFTVPAKLWLSYEVVMALK